MVIASQHYNVLRALQRDHLTDLHALRGHMPRIRVLLFPIVVILRSVELVLVTMLAPGALRKIRVCLFPRRLLRIAVVLCLNPLVLSRSSLKTSSLEI